MESNFCSLTQGLPRAQWAVSPESSPRLVSSDALSKPWAPGVCCIDPGKPGRHDSGGEITSDFFQIQPVTHAKCRQPLEEQNQW